MTATREEFEAWLHTECFQEPPSYCVDLAWSAWQAAHLAGLRAMQERAARLVEPTEDHRREPWHYIGGEEVVEMLDGIADKIRALEVKP